MTKTFLLPSFSNFICSCIILFFLVAQYAKAEVIKVYDAGFSQPMRDYNHEVVRKVLEASRETYGDYVLKLVEANVSHKRLSYEIVSGKHVDVSISTKNEADEELAKKIHHIDFPLYLNSLGLRRIIIRDTEHTRFSRVKTAKEFSKLIAGQAAGWRDILMYHHANIKVSESKTFDSLFAMLRARRFDYLPLGILEAIPSLELAGDKAKGMNLHEQSFIFYPLPIYLKMGVSRSDLIGRFTDGFEKVKANGELRALYDKHFSRHLKGTDKADVKLYTMFNPSIPIEQNIRITEEIQTDFFPTAKNVFPINAVNSQGLLLR